MKPFVKWAGGKRQILDKITGFINDSKRNGENYTYIEPFLGGGAVFFNLQPKKAIINDLNEDLINAYKVIKSEQYNDLIALLTEHSEKYKSGDADDYYYEVRSWDRQPNWPKDYSDVKRAARMIFLNRTCYNGLYRVNRSGQFNTPVGRYKNPLICDEENITEIHDYLSDPNNNIEIMSSSYEEAMSKSKDGDIIYIDPPYDYEDDDGFTKYQMSGFTFEDFKALKKQCDIALDNEAYVIISNNATTKVINLFKEDPHYKIFYDFNQFKTLRSINCLGAARNTGNEVIFWGMNNNILLPQADDMEKIIKLLKADENDLTNKEKIQKIIGVNTNRQVAYYLSALQFFYYMSSDKKLTERAKNLNKNQSSIEEDIFEQLSGNQIFKTVYDKFPNSSKIDKNWIEKSLKKRNKDLSDATISRRATTIKTWVKWMHDYSNRGQKLF